jgi:hypothetical protein
MRKITLIIALFFVALQADAQVLLSENFDTALNWTVTHVSGSATSTGWTRVTAGTNPTCSPAQGAGMAQFDSFNIATGNNYSLRSPAINFTGASYRVKFSMYRDGGYPDDADRIRVYYNTATTPGGTLLGTVNRSIALAPTVPAAGWYVYSFDLPANLTSTAYISFMATSAYGNRIYLDNVTISQIQNDDAEMSSIGLESISAAQGNTTITGTLKNMGANALTSVDLMWQADTGEIHTQNLTGLNVASGATYTYNHAEPWSAAPGQYSIKVWTANPNGNADTDNTNNELTKVVSIASNSTTRLPLYEKFSSSTCGPCATFNGTYFNGFFATNHDNLALINYQVNWPGAGDPYYTLETGSRVGFYGVNAAPTLFVNAVDGTNFSNTLLQSDLTAAMAKPAFFAVDASHSITGNDITVNVDVTPYLSGAFTLQAVVVERITYDNIATNGETEFHNVMMKMLPNPGGTVMNFVHDVPQSVELNASLTGLNIEEMDDLAVVVFIQNNADKSIMQSGYSTDLLATSQFQSAATIKMFPNPTEGIVRVSSTTPVDVVISDLTGKVILSQKAVTNETPIDLSAFQTGIYMAKMISGNAEQTQKIILK